MRVTNWQDALRSTVTRRGVKLGDLEDAELTPSTHGQLIGIVKKLKDKTGNLYEILFRRGGGNRNEEKAEEYIEELIEFLDTLLEENRGIHDNLNNLLYDTDKKIGDVIPINGGLKSWAAENAQNTYDQFLNGNPLAFLNTVRYVHSNLGRKKSLEVDLDILISNINQDKKQFTQRFNQYKTTFDELISESGNLLKPFLLDETPELDFIGYEFYNEARLIRHMKRSSEQNIRDVLAICKNIAGDSYLLNNLELGTTRPYRMLVPVLKANKSNDLIQTVTQMTQFKPGSKTKRGVGLAMEQGYMQDYANQKEWVDKNPEETQDEYKTRNMREGLKLIRTDGSDAQRGFERYLRSRQVGGSLSEFNIRLFNKNLRDEISSITSLSGLTILYNALLEETPIYQIGQSFESITEDTIEGAANGIKNIVVLMKKLNLIDGATKLTDLLSDADELLNFDDNLNLRGRARSLTEEDIKKFISKSKEIDNKLDDAVIEIQTAVASELNRCFGMLDPIDLRSKSNRIPRKGRKHVDEWLIENKWMDYREEGE
tara:strand:+ start:556 stop:2184 length:1629 start_codon:yes stop_codon:yes gene_type:complete